MKLPKGKTPIDIEFSNKDGNKKFAAAVSEGLDGPIVDKRTYRGEVFTGKDGTGVGVQVKDTKGVEQDIGIAKAKATHSTYVGAEGKYKDGRVSAKVYAGKEAEAEAKVKVGQHEYGASAKAGAEAGVGAYGDFKKREVGVQGELKAEAKVEVDVGPFVHIVADAGVDVKAELAYNKKRGLHGGIDANLHAGVEVYFGPKRSQNFDVGQVKEYYNGFYEKNLYNNQFMRKLSKKNNHMKRISFNYHRVF